MAGREKSNETEPRIKISPNERNGAVVLGHGVGASLSSRPCAYVGDRHATICGCYALQHLFFFFHFLSFYAFHSRGLLRPRPRRVTRIYAHLRIRASHAIAPERPERFVIQLCKRGGGSRESRTRSRRGQIKTARYRCSRITRDKRAAADNALQLSVAHYRHLQTLVFTYDRRLISGYRVQVNHGGERARLVNRQTKFFRLGHTYALRGIQQNWFRRPFCRARLPSRLVLFRSRPPPA